MAHGAHFLCESRLMVEFHVGNARSGGSFRYLSRRAIFPTHTFRAAGIWIFLSSTQSFLVASKGRDLTQNIDFQKRKVSLQGSTIFEGRDLNENGNFTGSKYVHTISFSKIRNIDILNKILAVRAVF